MDEPLSFALYQSGGPLLGVGETIDACLEHKLQWLITSPALMDDLGELITPATLQYTDCTADHPPPGTCELTGALYLRRATTALRQAWEAGPVAGAWHVGASGVVEEVPPAEKGDHRHAPTAPAP